MAAFLHSMAFEGRHSSRLCERWLLWLCRYHSCRNVNFVIKEGLGLWKISSDISSGQ